jgi:hypothetical protein
MRILRIFFSVTVLLILLLAVSWLIGRELLLSLAVGKLRSAVRELSAVQVPNDFRESCLEFGGPPANEQNLARTQLRFLDKTEFVVEVVCQASEALRVVVRQDRLPAFTSKGPGQSGLVQGRPFSGLTVMSFGRVGVVYDDDSFIQSSLRYTGEPDLVFDAGPATVCEGYGFQCCSQTDQQGQGEAKTSALDCPRSCFAQCLDQPEVLAFNSDPSPTEGNAYIELPAGQTIEFYYVVSQGLGTTGSTTSDQSKTLISRLFQLVSQLLSPAPAMDELAKIVIDFGDGETLQTSDLQGTVAHTYTCSQALCVYTASIEAETKAGLVSPLNSASQVEVRVK